MQQAMTRSMAKAIGLKRYFTGAPCRRGHISERHITGTCLECQREDKAAAYRANPDKFRARVISEYRRKNDGRLRHQLPKTSKADRMEAQRSSVRAHYAKNKAYYMTRSAERRARKLSAIPAWFGELDSFVMSEAARLVRMRSDATGIKWQADHMIPLACKTASGLHVFNNIQVIPARLNKSKGNRLIFTNHGEWIRHI